MMRTAAWLFSLLSVGVLVAPAADAAPTSARIKRMPGLGPAAKAVAMKTHCGEGKICPVHTIETLYGFSKAFADVHKQSSVMLALGTDGEFTGFCSGTLLGPNTIVTASHCFDESRGKGAKDTEVRVVWNYRKEKNGSWAWPRYVGRVMQVTKKFDKSEIDVAVATVRWKCGEVPPVAAPPGPKVSVGQKVISFQHPLGRETHVASGRVEGIDEHRADDFDENGPQVYAWTKMRAVNNGSGGGVFGPSGGLVGVVYHQYAGESGYVQLASIRDQVPRLNLWAHGDKLLGDIAAGAAQCIR